MAATTDGELIDIRTVASDVLGGCSIRHVRRLFDAHKMPSPVRLGALLRFRRSELDRWIADGCKPIRVPGKVVR